MMLYETRHYFERDWLMDKLEKQGYKTLVFDDYLSPEIERIVVVSPDDKVARMRVKGVAEREYPDEEFIQVSSLVLSDLEYDGGYLVSSKEEFDYLMINLEDQRYVWESGENPTDLSLFDEETNELLVYADYTKKTLFYTNVIPDENGIETIGENLVGEPPSVSEDIEEEEGLEGEEVLFDSHSPDNIDFFDIWHKTYSMDEFRAGMEMLASYFLYDRVGDRSINLSRAQDVIMELEFYEEFERINERTRSEKEG